jgi:sulfur-oxidizing protein SoxY
MMMNDDGMMYGTRRRFLHDLAALTGSTGLGLVLVRPATATPESMRAAVEKVTGTAPVQKGKVKLELPPLIENGNAVPLAISGDSPMTAADHIKAIHVFTEKNPQPNVITFHLVPRAGRAKVATRIRLADTQTVVAIAQMSDGSFWSDEVDVVVTLPACLEEGA